jgi:hypothetical protein
VAFFDRLADDVLISGYFVANELQSLSNNSVRKNTKHDTESILLEASFEEENLSVQLVLNTSTLLSMLSHFSQYSNHYINSNTTVGTAQENHMIIGLFLFITFRSLNFFPAISL